MISTVFVKRMVFESFWLGLILLIEHAKLHGIFENSRWFIKKGDMNVRSASEVWHS